MWRPLSQYILITVLPQSICYKLPLMCSKKYQIWLRDFKDKSKNVHWPHFSGPCCKLSLSENIAESCREVHLFVDLPGMYQCV